MLGVQGNGFLSKGGLKKKKRKRKKSQKNKSSGLREAEGEREPGGEVEEEEGKKKKNPFGRSVHLSGAIKVSCE